MCSSSKQDLSMHMGLNLIFFFPLGVKGSKGRGHYWGGYEGVRESKGGTTTAATGGFLHTAFRRKHLHCQC